MTESAVLLCSSGSVGGPGWVPHERERTQKIENNRQKNTYKARAFCAVRTLITVWLQVRVLRAHHIVSPSAFATVRPDPLKRCFFPISQWSAAFQCSPTFACCLLASRRFVGIFVGILSMPKRDTNMPLTDTKCRNAKGQIKPRKLSDGGGLHLLINPTELNTGAWPIGGVARTHPCSRRLSGHWVDGGARCAG